MVHARDSLFSTVDQKDLEAILSFFQPWRSQREVWSHAHAFIPPQRSASQRRPLTPHTTLSSHGATSLQWPWPLRIIGSFPCLKLQDAWLIIRKTF